MPSFSVSVLSLKHVLLTDEEVIFETPRTSGLLFIVVLLDSMYGHVKTMALSIKEGLEEKGCTVDLLQVPETLPSEVLAAMHAPPK